MDGIESKISPVLLKLALELFDTEAISAGKLSEWLFTPRTVVEEYLSKREMLSEEITNFNEE